MAQTIFTKIINREIPADIVFEDDQLLAFNDIRPQAPVHVLIIPKKEIPTTDDIKGEDAPLIGRMVLAAADIARKMGISDSGYRLVINCRQHGGQEVDHLHIHLLGKRQMQWPPG